MPNIVYIATSLDGYIADKDGKLDWLETIPNPGHDDLGYGEFITTIDAIVMGRSTFEVVQSFDIPWPYTLPVFVLSNSLQFVPEELVGKVEILCGTPAEVLSTISERGYLSLYIDGGNVIQSFLENNLIDELIITTIPMLLGGGVPLFSILSERQQFELVGSKTLLNAMVQTHYKKI